MLKPSLFRSAAAVRNISSRQTARETLKSRLTAPALPFIPTCPAPTCSCAETPANLDIDQDTNLNGTMAPYSEHLVVPTSQADWTSKIEDEKQTAPWGQFVANVKKALSQKGSFHDPYHNVVVTTSSFEPSNQASAENNMQAFLFPSFKVVESIDCTEDGIPDFIKAFLLPEKLHPAHDQLLEEEKQGKRRDISRLTSDRWKGNVRPISVPTILICSHNSRDSRCGVLGPLLHAEFTQYINKRHTLRNSPTDTGVQESTTLSKPSRTFASHPEFRTDAVDRDNDDMSPVNIGMISHIGGHKFAGNVIVYIPPDFHVHPLERKTHGSKPKDEIEPATLEKSAHDGDVLDTFSEGLSPLAGRGIWYGRVEPKHVEGIVEQTIGHGKIIKELFRGGVHADGTPIRIPLY